MTIPMPAIPNVQPQFTRFEGPPPDLMQQVQPGLQFLLQAMEAKRQRDQQATERATNRVAGEVVRDAIVNEGTYQGANPASLAQGMSGAFSQAMGMPGVLMPQNPVTLMDPLARAVSGRPGEAVLKAAPYLQGPLAERSRRIEARRTEMTKAMTPVKPTYEIKQDDRGYGKLVTTNLVNGRPTALDIYNEDGSRFRMKDPNAPGPGGGPGTDYIRVIVRDPMSPMFGKVVQREVSPMRPIDPAKEYPLENLTAANRDAAQQYTPMIESYQRARNTFIDPADAAAFDPQKGAFWTNLMSLVQTAPDAPMTGTLVANATLKPATRQYLQNVLALANARTYAQSGKAVTRGEFARILMAEIPLPLDEPALREEKWNRLEGTLQAVADAAEPALLLNGTRPKRFADVQRDLASQRGHQQRIAQLTAQVKAQHPTWTAAQVANEALRLFQREQPAVAPSPR